MRGAHSTFFTIAASIDIDPQRNCWYRKTSENIFTIHLPFLLRPGRAVVCVFVSNPFSLIVPARVHFFHPEKWPRVPNCVAVRASF
jgi:hypothetical protein